jgi:hypothetical protein
MIPKISGTNIEPIFAVNMNHVLLGKRTNTVPCSEGLLNLTFTYLYLYYLDLLLSMRCSPDQSPAIVMILKPSVYPSE